MFFHPKPVVAAINGHAMAGGCVLACCADRRIMARSERPYRRDRTTGRRTVSRARFRDGAVRGTGPLFSGIHVQRRHLRTDAALQRGWVDAVVPAETLIDECHGLGPANGAAIARGVRPSQEANPPARQRAALLAVGQQQDKIVTGIWACAGNRSAISALMSRRTLKKA